MSSTGTRMKSTRVTSITRRVPPVQHERVPVGILEEGHVADARVERLAGELDAARLELVARFGHVGHPQRYVRRVRALERRADVLHLQEVDADVLAELELGEPALADHVQAERVAIE